MIVCRECKADLYVGTLFCSECGISMLMNEVTATTELSLSSPLKGQTRPLEAIQTGVFEADRIVFVVPNSGRAVTMSAKNEIRIGRADPAHAFFPELDLTEESGIDFGVSRLHATIQPLDKGIMIIDRGSTNGTQLNKRRLEPHSPYPLQDGDEIRFGNLMVQIYFES
jgi:pSer/pThr/pTyr-binding forkhead associated (FHA) protein